MPNIPQIPFQRKPQSALNAYQRGIVVGMVIQGASFNEIKAKTGVSTSTLRDIVHAAKNAPADWDAVPRLAHGNIRATTTEQDDKLRDASMQNPDKSLAEIKERIMPEICLRTARRRLSEVYIEKWRALKRTALEEEHAAQRLEWALKYRSWTAEMWMKCVFVDEMSVERGMGGRPKWVFRASQYTNERWKRQSDKYGRKSVHEIPPQGARKISQMMMGAFVGRGNGIILPLHGDPLSERGGVTGRRYLAALKKSITEILRNLYGNDRIFFTQDNAGIHRYLPVIWFLDNLIAPNRLPVERIQLCPYSPDLNPIEHVWAIIKWLFNRLYPDMWKEKGDKDMIKKKIEEAVTHCWELITPEYFEKLARSMVDRVEAVIEAEGWYTKY